MTDERDPKVSQRYRELGREEPPGELDAGISRPRVAPRKRAWRRSCRHRPAPLVFPGGCGCRHHPRRRRDAAHGAAAIGSRVFRVTLGPTGSEKRHLLAAPPQESPAKPLAPPPPSSRTADAMQQGASAEARRESGAPARLLGRSRKPNPPKPRWNASPSCAGRGDTMRRTRRSRVQASLSGLPDRGEMLKKSSDPRLVVQDLGEELLRALRARACRRTLPSSRLDDLCRRP